MGTTEETQIPTVEEQVNTILKTAVDKETNKLVLPDDIAPELAVAVRAEKKYRDTQASYTKTRQQNKLLEEQVNQYTELVTKVAQPKLTDEQIEELDTLKYENPDAWRTKLNQYEQEAKQQVTTQLTEATAAAQKQAEVARRGEVLKSYNDFRQANGKKPITDDVIEAEVPPRLLKQLELGELVFDDFLQEVGKYIDTPKTIAKVEGELGQPNLSDAAGAATPSEPSADEVEKAYAKQVF